MKFCPQSKISCSRIVLLERPSCRTGTVAASNLRILPGNIPGGMLRMELFICETTCATAISTWTFGWKKILMTAMLLYDCDSMCSMSFTFEVRFLSKFVTTRFSISSGDRPKYCQRTLTMGMSM